MAKQPDSMNVAHISAGAAPHRNDDHVVVYTHGGATDILVIDGATSVADVDHLDPVQGDVAWFVHAFTVAIGHELRPGRSQHACVHAAVDAVRTRFEQQTQHRPVPLHAWPIAALTWLRIGDHDATHRAALYCLGDCKSLLRTPAGDCVDLDPFVNPQDAILQAEIGKLRAQGLGDPDARRERMLPMLRARREFQNTEPAPGVLCLRPNGGFLAREHSVAVQPGATVLIMTDGFYRLVDLYGRYSDAGLVDACIERGLPTMLDELRTHEAVISGAGVQAVKAADDASAAMWSAC